MIGLAVIGYGYWGPNIVRNFSEISDVRVRIVADIDKQRLYLAQTRYPVVEVTTDVDSVFSRSDVNAIALATPVSSHFGLALRALEAGKHVFVEKPLTRTAEEAQRLIEEADRRKLVLHVDHTFLYTGAVRKIKELVDHNALGQLYYYDSVRVNLGLFQPDVDVVWDLAVHDLSIIDFLRVGTVTAVSASGVNHVQGRPINVAFLTIFFENDFIAHLHVNWLAPVKLRRTLLGGSTKMLVYDDLEPSEKIKVYDKGITVISEKEGDYLQRIDYRTGDMWAPKVEITEALQLEAQHFMQCIVDGETSLSDGRSGLRVVEMLEAASWSMNEQGRPVKIGWKGSKRK